MNSELPTTATGVLRLNPSTKSQVYSFVNQVVREVEDGNVNPLEVLTQCRAIEKAVKELLPEIESYILKEADKYPEKSFDFLGNSLEKSESSVTYHYEKSGDTEWEMLDAEIKSLEARKKARETWLRTMAAPENIVDGNGEVVTVRPAPRTSKSIVKVTLK